MKAETFGTSNSTCAVYGLGIGVVVQYQSVSKSFRLNPFPVNSTTASRSARIAPLPPVETCPVKPQTPAPW